MREDDYSKQESEVIFCARSQMIGFTFPKGVPLAEREAANTVCAFLEASIRNDALVLWMRERQAVVGCNRGRLGHEAAGTAVVERDQAYHESERSTDG